MKKVLFSLLLAMSYINVHAQNSISGRIVDPQENTPLAGVEVYLPQLEKGTVTTEDGSYNIANLPTGNYKLLASYLGYQTFSKTVEISEGNTIVDINLNGSAIEMEEVIVSTPFHKLQSENVMKVERAGVKELKSKGAVTLAEGIGNIAGVETFATGLGIGKPVIRGLSSNRVLVYAQGIRLENQQYGDEHGLGLSDAGIESVEVIKGPASLLYGSDALGGVLYLNPEKFANSGETTGDVNLNYFSNTTGINGNAGFQTSGEKLKFLIRGGGASHTDYSTGNGQGVINSRFNEYDLKTGLAYQLSNFKTELRYNFNSLQLGLPEDLGPKSNDRKPLGHSQEIDNHIISSKTTFFFEKSSVEAILGYTINNREEFEDHEHEEEEEEYGEEHHEDEDGMPALDMVLKTFNYNLKYNLAKIGNLESIIGIQGMRQTNENFGEEILIPNATTNDIGVLATAHLHFENGSDLQFGLRFDNRSIDAEENGSIDEIDYIAALNRKFNSFNAAVGYKLDLAKSLTARLNIASGFRAPNLAELTSNGTHEGTNRFEIGNANLDNEQNIQTDFSLEYKNQHLELYANGFYNAVNDFIFLEPNGDFVGEDPVFIYRQQSAKLYGGELGLHLHPHPLDWLHIESSYQTVRGELSNGDNLPLIPANSLTNTLRFEFSKTQSKIQNSYAFITLQSVFDQDNVSLFETETPGYQLLNLGFGGRLSISGQPFDVTVSANNLLDENYIAHLSRLKPDGIANIGRNISLGLSIPL